MKKSIKIGSAQINNGFSNQYYLPYSIGILQAFILHNSKKHNYIFKDTIYKREDLNICVDKLKDSDIVFFSIYVWNEKISLKIGEELKKSNKDILLVYGGPSVPDNKFNMAEKFLRENQFIDLLVHQEGERTSLQIVENFPSKNYDQIDNISFLKENKYFNKPNLPRLRDFSQVPSPYLCGVFDNIIKNNPTERWLASWETNRGCPFSCAFCDWGSATASKVSRMDLDRVFRELDWFSKHKVEFIFCCDANFGMLPRDYEIAKRAAENKKKYGYPKVLSVQNTKNARDRAYKVQKLLAENELSKGVTLAMQSVNPHTLKAIKRDNISLEDYAELQRRFAEDKIPTYTEFILGLPGDSYDDFASGVSNVIKSGQHNRIQYNNLSILPNAEMNMPDYREKYKIKTVPGPIVNVHGSLEEEPKDGIKEEQHVVISTSTLKQEEWVETRAYASVSEFLYFNKILQIPILLLSDIIDISFRKIFEDFLKSKNFKTLNSISTSFYEHAKKICEGRPEFIRKNGMLDIYWPPGEYEYIKMYTKNTFDKFYDEANLFLGNYLDDNFQKEIVSEAIKFNRNIMRQPSKLKDTSLDLKFNIPDYFNHLVKGKKTDYLQYSHPVTVEILRSDRKFENIEEWMREVVWYGHRSGAYLYKFKVSKNLENMDNRGASKRLSA